MNIAVTTPNGTVGSHLVRTLIRAGVEPLILVRDPEKVPRELRGLVRIARADARVPEQVAAATRGGGGAHLSGHRQGHLEGRAAEQRRGGTASRRR